MLDAKRPACPGMLRRALALLIIALTLTACGAGMDSPASPTPSSAGNSAESAAPSETPEQPAPAPSVSELPERAESYTTELAITLLPEPGAEPIHYVLACQGTEPSSDSNVPDPAAACELIQKSAEALFFTASDPTLQCTQQFGGPQTATIKGIIDNRPVERSFSLSDGCEINRWRTLEPLLGPGGLR